MLSFPKDLSTANILISNDDSIHAQGIKELEKAARTFTDNIWVVAPENEQSAAGHSLTIHSPLRIRKYDDKHYSVFGTPTDSALMGIKHVMADKQIDLVLSGINHGRNVADDVTYSGTIAAVIEATLLGYPAIAFSQDSDDEISEKDKWGTAQKYLPKILKKLEGHEWVDNVFLNVNFPAVKDMTTDLEIVVVEQGHYSAPNDGLVTCTDPRGRPYYWIGPLAEETEDHGYHTDIGALKKKAITITPLSLNMTHRDTLKSLGKVFS